MKSMIYRTTHGARPALLVLEGTKFDHLVMFDAAGIRITKTPISERRYMKPLDYPAKRFARRLLKAGKVFGITKTARTALRA